MSEQPKPPPGSTEALDRGCVCPPYGNHQGKGLRGNGKRYGWAVDPHCELHRGLPCVDEVRHG